MLYLKEFTLLDEKQEHAVACYEERRTIYETYYPLRLFTSKQFQKIFFSPITIFYGGNGSGKSTLLNIMSQKLKAEVGEKVQKGSYFDHYVEACQCEMEKDAAVIKKITSDDVFDYLLGVRAINAHVDRKKEELSELYLHYKFEEAKNFMDEYGHLKDKVDADRMSMSKFVRSRLGNNTIVEHSNGESALLYWEREITEDGLYFLDEPENSLSAENQLKLKQYIEESVRFYNCQFIISTHSPFLLNLIDAKIYNLDRVPVEEAKWTELENVRLYYEFFKEHQDEFE